MSRVRVRIAPTTPYTIRLSALLRLATYTSVDQGLGTSIDYRAIQGVTGTLGAYSDALYAFTSREFGKTTKLTARQRYRRTDTGISINRRFVVKLKFAHFNS